MALFRGSGPAEQLGDFAGLAPSAQHAQRLYLHWAPTISGMIHGLPVDVSPWPKTLTASTGHLVDSGTNGRVFGIKRNHMVNLPYGLEFLKSR